MNEDNANKELDENRDPLTGATGAHPVGTGLGAAAVGGAGLAVAAAVAAGPVGIAAAVIGGAIAGGYAGKAAAEVIDPTVEDEYWRSAHGSQAYADPTLEYTHYEPAYRTGYESFQEHGTAGRSFEEVEPQLQEAYRSKGGTVPWEKARDASRAAWARVEGRRKVPTEPPV